MAATANFMVIRRGPTTPFIVTGGPFWIALLHQEIGRNGRNDKNNENNAWIEVNRTSELLIIHIKSMDNPFN